MDYDFNYMFTDVKPLIENYDLKYYNQETIIGGKNLGVSHYPQFNSPDEIGQNLVDMGYTKYLVSDDDMINLLGK